jgi:hypothetical protein
MPARESERPGTMGVTGPFNLPRKQLGRGAGVPLSA